MPKNKDLKRLTRARMKKAGESYTTARSHLVEKLGTEPETETTEHYATLAGMSDQAVHAKTGRNWVEWVQWLDDVSASKLPHPKIASALREQGGISPWWAQSVTVGYERIKGLRQVGQLSSGSFATSKSKTVKVPLAILFRAFRDGRMRKRWLPGKEWSERTATLDKSIRVSWEGGSSVEIYFYDKGETKSQVALQHSKLESKAEAAAMKEFWGERFRALEKVLLES